MGMQDQEWVQGEGLGLGGMRVWRTASEGPWLKTSGRELSGRAQRGEETGRRPGVYCEMWISHHGARSAGRIEERGGRACGECMVMGQGFR